MKKSIPSLDSLINRYHQSIQLRHPDVPIDSNGILFLKTKWRGQEAKLYKIVKEMENEEVKVNNQNKRIDHRTVTFQVGVDCLGFVKYYVHENVFSTEIDRKLPKGTPNQIHLKSRSYYLL